MSNQTLTDEMTMFLLSRPRPKLRVSSRCRHTDHLGQRCKAPVWGDGYVTCSMMGRVDNHFHGVCSPHWHLWNAFHGAYTTMQANPAAAKLDATGISRLTFPSDWL